VTGSRRVVPLIAALAFGLTACGTSGSAETNNPDVVSTTDSQAPASTTIPETTTSTTEVTTDEARLEETRLLAEDIGFACSPWRLLGDPATGAVCSTQIVFSIHADESAVQRVVDELNKQLGKRASGWPMLWDRTGQSTARGVWSSPNSTKCARGSRRFLAVNWSQPRKTVGARSGSSDIDPTPKPQCAVADRRRSRP